MGETGRRLTSDTDIPAWMARMVDRIDAHELPDWVLHATAAAPTEARASAVLMLLADGGAGAHLGGAGAAHLDGADPELLLISRSRYLRAHAGQPAFPGGACEPGEGPVATALREAQEETGLRPHGVIPAALLPTLYLRPSGFAVTPVLAYWREPTPVWPVDTAETERVLRASVSQLADPAHRGTVSLRTDRYDGRSRTLRTPAFEVGGLVVWGFTAGLVDVLLEWGGWARPWDRSRELTPEIVRPPAGVSIAEGGERGASYPDPAQVPRP